MSVVRGRASAPSIVHHFVATMNNLGKILFAVGVLCLVSLYIFPMWSISLEAPQYPEGLGLKIHINDVRGARPNELESINGLNHYIGMKEIKPDAIAELKYMPWIVAGLIILGLIVAFIGKRMLAWIWIGLTCALGALGIYDFYLWSYDYGHNLDPHAIIKIEGMSYQPPIIGTKVLLNFTAHSWPDIGGILMGVGILLAMFAAWKFTKTS